MGNTIAVKEKILKRKNLPFLKGAVTIATGGFVAKLIGALYRIPLTNLIGGYGIGLYQMAYPFYCLLLTVSATGIPSSISAIVSAETAKGERARNALRPALKLFFWIGLAGTALMVALAPILSFAQGESALTEGYIALAPSVALVSVLSVFRGWFQGQNQMRPTAVSEILEQAVKVGFGLLFAYLYRGNIQKAVAFLLLAVTISESVAVVFMVISYKRVPAPMLLRKNDRVPTKEILKTSVFVTLSSALLPLSNLVESVLLVRLMDGYAENAVALYGLFSGGAVTVINFPVSVCYGVAVASVPSVAKERGNGKEKTKKSVLYAISLTLLISIPCAIGLYLFAPTVVGLVYRALSASEKTTLVRLVRAFSVSAVTHSGAQTASACLTAQGKAKHTVFSTSIGIVLKILLDVLFVSNPKYSIMGAVIASNVCYAVMFLIELIMNMRLTKD